MQHPYRQPSKPHRQLHLEFATPEAVPAIPPAWRVLPEPAQRTVTELLTRLLMTHADAAAPKLALRPGGQTDER